MGALGGVLRLKGHTHWVSLLRATDSRATAVTGRQDGGEISNMLDISRRLSSRPAILVAQSPNKQAILTR